MAWRRSSIAWKAAFTIVLLAYLTASWGSGLDRLTRGWPALQEFVPTAFRAEAARQAALLALEQGNGSAALAEARRAVDAEPVHPMSTALLGAARQIGGAAQGADPAFRVAGMLGWRARLTQLYWYDAAVRSGDWPLAAIRADAVLRVDPAFPLSDRLLAPLEASEPGQSAIAARLALRPDWLESYFHFKDEGQGELLGRRTKVALALAARGVPLGCKTPAFLAARLLARGERAQAEELWRGHCGDPGRAAGLSDGRFERLATQGATPPFGWIRHSSGDITARLVALGEDGGHVFRASNFGDVSRLALSQRLALRPGRYRFFAEMRTDGRATPGAYLASLDCDGAARRPRRIMPDPAGEGQLLNAGACSGQTLGLWLQPGTRNVDLGNLRIEAAD